MYQPSTVIDLTKTMKNKKKQKTHHYILLNPSQDLTKTMKNKKKQKTHHYILLNPSQDLAAFFDQFNNTRLEMNDDPGQCCEF